MTYAVHDDLVSRFGATEILQLADRNGDGMEDSGVVTTALTDADLRINSYISARYAASMPFATTPPELVLPACNLARYFLWGARASDEVKARYQDAIAWLEAVQNGAATLASVPPPASGSDDVAPLFSSRPQVFTRERLHDFLHPGQGTPNDGVR